MDFYIYCLFVVSFALFESSAVNYLNFPDNRPRTIWGKIIYFLCFIVVSIVTLMLVPEFYYLVSGNTLVLICSSLVFLLASVTNFNFSNFDATIMNISFPQKMIRMMIEYFVVLFIIILIAKRLG